MNDKEFEYSGIDKIEGFSLSLLEREVGCIFKDKASIVDFGKLVTKLREFPLKTIDERHKILVDIAFYRAQLEKLKKQLEDAIAKRESVLVKAAAEELRKTGQRPTVDLIKAHRGDDMALDNLRKMHVVCSEWHSFLQDQQYTAQTTNKIVGNV